MDLSLRNLEDFVMSHEMAKRRIYFLFCLLLLFSFFVIPSFPQEINESVQPGILKAIILSRTNNILEAKIILNSYTSSRLFELSEPNRIVIDLFNIENKETSSYIFVDDPKIRAVRTSMFMENVARIVFDLNGQIPFYKIERIPVGLRLLVGEKEVPSAIGEDKETGKIQRESLKAEGLEKQSREIKASLDRVDGKLEDIKKILKEVLQNQGQIKTQPTDQTEQPADQQERIPSVDQSFSEERIAPAAVLDLDSIKIDGNLDEISWGETLVLTDFTQHEPIEGALATEKTEVKIFFGKDSMYIGVRAFDTNPEKIVSILARRDSDCPSDWIKIWIDSYHDHLTAFEFAVNPSGVKMDAYWSIDKESDVDWDAVWDVEILLDERGWVAEFRIPYSQIRFHKKESHAWGFQVCRVIARKNETSYWRHVPTGVPRFVSLFGDLKGITGIPAPRRLQLVPYTMGKGSFQPAEEGNPFQTGSSYPTNMGLDLKYGISSNITLDASFNPDFGQVESDPAIVNLTADETYFSEKRPFFIEDKNLLSFPLGSGQEFLFYSRRIGRAPQGYPSSAQYASIPENTTILGAFKLTGKTTRGWTIGVMEALAGKERASVISWQGEKTEEIIEPFTNYFLGRVEKEFRDGRSTLALIFTAVNRKIEQESLNFLRKAAYSGGFRFRNRWARDTYEVSGLLIGSHILGSKEAILKAQQSPARYFQRTDAPHLKLDPDRTSLSGFYGYFSLDKIGGKHWFWSIRNRIISPGFEVNDIGYLRWADWIIHDFRMSYREYKPGKIFRKYDITFSLNETWDYGLTHLGYRASLNFHVQFLNYWDVSLNLNRGGELQRIGYLRGGPGVLMPGSWRLRGSLRTDSRKTFFLNLSGNISFSDDEAISTTLSSNLTIRPSSRIHLSFSPSFSNSSNMLQWVTRKTVDDQSHYILGRIDRTTVSLTVRVNYTITPTLSLQLYTQPFVSAGDYSEFKEVIQPRAENYEDRWHIFEAQEITPRDGYYQLYLPWTEGEEITFNDPDFNSRKFRLNLVLRWEYLLGSTIFLVWTNGMNDYAKIGSVSLRNDLRSLFSSPSNNVFLFKINYWFNM